MAEKRAAESEIDRRPSKNGVLLEPRLIPLRSILPLSHLFSVFLGSDSTLVPKKRIDPRGSIESAANACSTRFKVAFGTSHE